MEHKNQMHNLKIHPKYFKEVCSGVKKFELRKNDRFFKDGDILNLQEFFDGKLTGKQIQKEIGYILKDCSEYGLEDGYCILGFKEEEKPLFLHK